MKNIFYSLFILLLTTQASWSQIQPNDIQWIKSLEDSIKVYGDTMVNSKQEEERFIASYRIVKTLKAALKATNSYQYQFDSMLPIQPGSIIVGEYVDDWKQMKNNDTYIIVSKNEGIVYKRVMNRLKEQKSLLLKSDNKSYEPYPISLDDIMEVWKAKAFISTSFPEPEQEMSISQLTNIMMEMQKKINSIS